MNGREFFDLLKQTAKEWNKKDPFLLSAAVAYYAILSLPAVLILVINIAGAVWGEEAIEGIFEEELGDTLGEETAGMISTMIENAALDESSLIFLIAGIFILILGATGVFFQLQKVLNRIWNVKADPDAGIKKMILSRVFSFGVILIVALLLVVSLVLSAIVSAFSDWVTENIHRYAIVIFYIIDVLANLVVLTVLFGALFKVLPDVEIRWKEVWIGGFATAILFVIGKYILTIYFSIADPGSIYGAAGSIILILLWISYTCLIIFFGAQFTMVYARRYGKRIVPSDFAVSIPRNG